MLSILIPIYNFAVKELVNELSCQAQDLNIQFEILCVDDTSKATYIKLNDGLEKIEGVNYQLNKKNIGRSAIRNLLTDKAQYDYLLFLDCDVRIGDNFIKKYIDFKDESEVIVGGVSYAEYEQLEKSNFLNNIVIDKNKNLILYRLASNNKSEIKKIYEEFKENKKVTTIDFQASQ